ncbi:MAG: orotidine-5'-phosphate decarboxylase [Bdellovibrionales bacterium]|nr:orotidine-5'-phosphate decarboxylase [Bdellovibrionales bacterium]
MNLNPPYFLALDLDDGKKALALAQQLAPHVGGFKIGPRLCLRYGEELIQALMRWRPVFVDHKYFDIPSTTCAAVETTFALGAQFVTVHAQVGSSALAELAKLEKKLNEIRPFKILAVTVLTSFNQSTLPVNSRAMPIRDQVLGLCQQVMESGLTGIVCSPEELPYVRSQFPESFLVVPGIRLQGQNTNDQNRVSGPREALTLGASALVVGRPIIEAEDPVMMAQKIQNLLLGVTEDSK